MTLNWNQAIVGQLEFYWEVHLRPRLEGLTDEEYWWEPASGSLGLRPDANGELVFERPDASSAAAPVTTVAWRIAHIGMEGIGMRARAFFGPSEAPEEADMFDPRHWPEPLPATAADAIAFLELAYGLWHEGIAALSVEEMERPLGPKGGPFADDTMADLVLHLNREVMAHGAEICLLRDLYRANTSA
ncbi:DinB family protein [Glycomyces harbinensis]|uniref:DinB superfamily protein n=1 Tax=Glycomyces harbinensis TaxID=58114 RepID=A0A1G6XC14_9ACTN|nr:DinB family protein [Glycomyces harbinensis]SDD75708.1 DinB superfamily protein [Glycomyces harbinensis]